MGYTDIPTEQQVQTNSKVMGHKNKDFLKEMNFPGNGGTFESMDNFNVDAVCLCMCFFFYVYRNL